ncbi:MAG TPA: rod shape-determining protein MreD [Opitutaceae bacterium]|jgi:rod shape-determining protein MreD|nr:rod shape-determining protein MreD [Opitutaceae bacterium]
MRGAFILFVTLYVLQALVAGVNSLLSGFHLWLFAGGLYVAYSALAMPFGEGFTATFLGGLLCDAMAPVAFGTHAVLFAVAHAVVYNLRERMQREDTTVRVVIALAVNAAVFVAVTLMRLGFRHLGEWPRALSDLVWSEALVAVIAPWFFALQQHSLELARANPQRSA